MFKLNLKIALRNLWKNKGFTALNIFGLSVGLAGFLMILLFANHEKSFDKWNPKADDVYRLSIKWSAQEDEYASSPAELAPALKEMVPEIADFARYYTWDLSQRLVSDGRNEMYVDHIMGVDSAWFNLFPYKFIYGDPQKALQASNQIVISKKTSEQFFGNTNPVGKTITINTNKPYSVSGVYETPSTPEHLDIDGFIKMSSNGDGWGNGNFYTYLLLKSGSDRELVEKKINAAFKMLPALKAEEWLRNVQIFITPVKEIYLYGKTAQDPAKRGNPAIVTILLLFSGLLLVIACINFTNLSIAQSIKRAKETGVRKVLGARKGNLISYFLTDTAVQCIIALLIALAIAEVSLPVLNRLMGLDLSIFSYAKPWQLIAQIGAILCTVVILSGGYAAFFLSNFQPVKVLKGNFSRSSGSLWIRKSLIGVQFIVATVFMVSLVIIKQQVNFIKNKDVGFNKDHVLLFKIRKGDTRKNFQAIKQRLLEVPGVTAVSRVNYYPGLKDMQIIGREFKGQSVQNLSVVTVDFDYFKVMGIRALTGHVFSKELASDSTGIVVNESAVKKYGLQKQIGTTWIDGRTLVGVVKDHVQRGMEHVSDPTAYVIEGRGTNRTENVILKVNGNNLQETISDIKRIWEEAEPFPFQYTWLDESFAKVYVQYVRLDKLFNIFTYVTLLIAVLGLFALASFTVQERTKEIGIRKVMGAETRDILTMLNKSFLFLVLIANCLAIPIAFILSSNWLSGFAYRTEITIWPFILAILISIIVTIITVSLQAFRTAKANPVDALKYE